MALKDLSLKIYNLFNRWESLFIVLVFALWFACFKDFFFGRLPLLADAVSYFEHIGFYTDNLKNGVYPLWNPFWVEGAPYQFFLRRIGDVNPFLSIIVFLKWVGFSHACAYGVFLAVYYFLSALAVYLIARLIFRDSSLALIAYTLFLFSSWGSQLFYNYIILIFLPIIWFFYFLLSFNNRQTKGSFLGICFCLGLIMTTYIPFYFLIILLSFVFFAFLLYFKECQSFLSNGVLFLRTNKIFMVFCCLFLFLSAMPAYTFYKESKKGGFVMPHRNAGADSDSAVAVGLESTVSGDIINHAFFEKIFHGYENIGLGDFFMPILFFIILLFGLFYQINKLIFFLFLNILLLFAVSITTLTGLYEFLFKHIPFFQFIRNIYYLFWIAILPMAILLAVASLKSFLDSIHEAKTRLWPLVNLFFVFGFFVIFLYMNEAGEWGEWGSLLIFWICFLGSIIWRVKFTKSLLFVGLLLLGIFIQSFQVYNCLTSNLRQEIHKNSDYRPPSYKPFKYVQSTETVDISDTDKRNTFVKNLQADLYYASFWYSVLYSYVSPKALANYTNYKLKFYDNVVPYQDNELFHKVLDEVMLKNQNVAFVAQNESNPSVWIKDPSSFAYAENIQGPTPQLKVRKFGPNSLELDVHLSKSRFLVVNDCYHKGWKLWINGKPASLLRANVAFKGFWVPAGESRITLSFSNNWEVLGHMALLLLFGFVAVYVLVLNFKERVINMYE